MHRKKILWLVSWYPNKNDRFDGDFIQRHARAAAIHHDVHVIFVTDADQENETQEEWNYATGLTEQIIYFKKKKAIAARLRKQIAWKRIYLDAVKKYVAKHGLPNGVHVHIPWKAGLIALWMKKRYGTGFLVTEHWGMYSQAIQDSVFNWPVLTQRLLKEIYQNSTVLITPSNFLAEGVTKFSGKSMDAIIPNVVDTTLFFPREEKYSRFTFIHVSNMVKLKNVGSILGAFTKAADSSGKSMQLILIGNRDEEYVRMAEQLGVLNTSVFFRGEINYAEVAREMQRSHAFVLFSDSETFSCVTAEALCCGLPVISSGEGALTELVNNTNGILVRVRDEQALAIAMIEIMGKYDSLDRKKISGDASQQFSYAAVAQRFDDLYQRFC